MKNPPPLFDCQVAMAKASVERPLVFNTSDPGTGKTRGALEGFIQRRAGGQTEGRMLVVAPLSILEAAWGDDVRTFTALKYEVAHGNDKKRRAAFESTSDIVLINHDGVKWLARKENIDLLDGFTDLVIDEFTAFKNRTAQRSKAMLTVSLRFEHITELSGSPNPNTVLDVWHPVFILDHGKRLGDRFFRFRSQVCRAEQVGPSTEHIKWVDKPGAEDVIADAVSDISIRFRLEDCHDIPPNRIRFMHVDMPRKVMAAYKEMEKESVLQTDMGQVSAIHAGARVKKMLQILSGAVYDEHGVVHPVHNERYALVLQLVMERKHSIVAFNWSHEREALTNLATKLGVTYAVIDGKVSAADRLLAVNNFQAGRLQVVFCHPQSAAHGLTLTMGSATIWCTPTYNAEHYKQFNQRIYRAGQTKKTETICIAARNTREEDVYQKLNSKLSKMTDLLDLFATQTKIA